MGLFFVRTKPTIAQLYARYSWLAFFFFRLERERQSMGFQFRIELRHELGMDSSWSVYRRIGGAREERSCQSARTFRASATSRRDVARKLFRAFNRYYSH